jgi:hypothetical protein
MLVPTLPLKVADVLLSPFVVFEEGVMVLAGVVPVAVSQAG